MKNSKLATKRQLVIDVLIIKAAKIFNSYNWKGNFNIENWDKFRAGMYKTARYSAASEWKYNCEEMLLNLTR